MELDFNKLISYRNIDKAEVGKTYYFIDSIGIQDLHNVEDENKKDVLIDVNSEFPYPFISKEGKLHFGFIYPCEEEKQYLTYEELKERWIKNPTELYHYKDDYLDITGMITDFNDEKRVFTFAGILFSETPRNEVDDWLIKNLTTLEGNSLVKDK